MISTIVALNLAGWGVFLLAILPHHLRYAGLGVGIGVAFTAWTLGCRHAFDADHIAVIDNTTRKLLADGKRPLGTGFFFALGHATIMLVVGSGIAIAARPVFHAVVTPNSTFATAGGVAGTILSAAFLWLLAGMNLVVLAGIVRVFLEMRRGHYTEVELEAQLQARGLMNRLFGRWMRSIKHARHLFFVGLVFGISFDTATEVLLLAGTAAAATQGLPFYAVLALPLLFAGGLTLFDSFDGFFMNTAYGWAFARPVRKVFYNITITSISVAVALIIGTVELVSVLADRADITTGPVATVADIPLDYAGYGIVGLFVASWLIAVAIWRFGRIEDKWSSHLATREA
jgi:nickel/cobalt transporter (NiCoT) family protein